MVVALYVLMVWAAFTLLITMGILASSSGKVKMRCRERPISVRLLRHIRLRSAPEIDAHLRGIWTLIRICTRELASTRGYCASSTFDVAGLKPSETYAEQKVADISIAMAIRRIAYPPSPDNIMVDRKQAYRATLESM